MIRSKRIGSLAGFLGVKRLFFRFAGVPSAEDQKIKSIRAAVSDKMAVFEKGLSQSGRQPVDLPKKEAEKLVTPSRLEAMKRDDLRSGMNQALRTLRSLKPGSKVYDSLRKIDRLHLYHAVNSPFFQKLSPSSILLSLVYAHKTNLIKVYQSEDIKNAMNKVAEYLHKMTPAEVASFAILLSSTKVFDER